MKKKKSLLILFAQMYFDEILNNIQRKRGEKGDRLLFIVLEL